MSRPRSMVLGAAFCLALLCEIGDACAEQGGAAPELTLAFGGDVYIDAPTRRMVEQRAREVGTADAYRELLAEVAPTFERASVAIINLETPVSPRYREREPGDPPIFNASPDLLDALGKAGVDAVTVANNHAFDQGFAGLRDTLNAAAAQKLPTVGASETPEAAAGPVKLSTDSGTIALCAATESFNVQPHDAPIEDGDGDGQGTLYVALTRGRAFEKCLHRARRDSDLTVAAIHFTPSVWSGPTDDERQLVQAAVEAGADIVVCHGPHIPGHVARIRAESGREALVVYSLGNLIGAMGREVDQWRSPAAGVRDAPVLVVTARRSPAGHLVPAGFEVLPFWIADPTPRAPWWPEGQQLTRPLSVRAELRRLAAADCGARCDRQARGYQRRERIMAAAFGLPAPREGPSLEAEARAEAEEPPEVSAPPAATTSEPELPPGADVELGTLMSGVTLPVSFRENHVEVDVGDAEEIDRLVRLLLRHRDLRIHLTGTGVADEDILPPEQLGARRARAVMWLLSARGPSRSRFVMHGEVGDQPRVTLRLTR